MSKKHTPLYGFCDKCNTEFSELFEFEDRHLCKANACFQEEVERASEKHLLDEEKLNDYRKLVAGTNI